MTGLPVRGPAVRELGLPLPPARMPLLNAGRPLKRWRYVAVFRADLMLCVAEARVAGMPQRWWAVALPDGTLEGRTTQLRAGVRVAPGQVRVEADDVLIELRLREGEGVEVASPHGRSWIWTRKQALVPVRGRVRLGERQWEVDGPDGFVDDSAGYHARHTVWHWSAGLGRTRDGQPVAWNLVDGLHDSPAGSERTVWVEGEPHGVGAQAFAADLSSVGDLRFSPWSERTNRTNRLVMRNRYRQPFGTFSGALPGGLELASGHGVMEWHDVHW